MSQQEYDEIMETEMPGWKNLESYIREVSRYLYCAVLRAEKELDDTIDHIELRDSEYAALIARGVMNLGEIREIYNSDIEFIKKHYFSTNIEAEFDMFHVEHSDEPENIEFENYMVECTQTENWREHYSEETIKRIKEAYDNLMLQKRICDVTMDVAYFSNFIQFTTINEVNINYQGAADEFNKLIKQGQKEK